MLRKSKSSSPKPSIKRGDDPAKASKKMDRIEVLEARIAPATLTIIGEQGDAQFVDLGDDHFTLQSTVAGLSVVNSAQQVVWSYADSIQDLAIDGENYAFSVNATVNVADDFSLIGDGPLSVTGSVTAGDTITIDGGGQVTVTGSLRAAGGGVGGTIVVTGDHVSLQDNALIDASGDFAGGKVLIGGDYQGSNPNIRNATTTLVGPDVQIHADALINGDGGRAILWSESYTEFKGLTTVRGGAEGGDGGFIEVSGSDFLVTGLVDANAPHGAKGNILFDPTDLIITNSTDGGDNVSIATINSALAGGNVTYQATSSITFQNSGGFNISNSTGSNLTFEVISGGAGGINTDDAIPGHGSISLSGGSSTLSFLAGIGGIDLYDAPTQGGTSFVATNVNVLASGQIVLANAEANDTFTARSTGSNLFTGTDGYIRGNNSINLRANGHIAKTDLSPITIDGSGSLFLNNVDFDNNGGLGSERVIRVTGNITTASVVDVDTRITTNGMSVFDVRGAGGTILFRHNAGVISGTGLSGAGKAIDYTNNSTANFNVNGLSAGSVLMNVGGALTLTSVVANDPVINNSDVKVSAGTITIANGATVTALDELFLTAFAGDITSAQIAGQFISGGNTVLTASAGSVGPAGNPVRVDADVLSGTAGSIFGVFEQDGATLHNITAGPVNVTSSGSLSVASTKTISGTTVQLQGTSLTNDGAITGTTSATVTATTGSLSGAGLVIAPAVTLQGVGVGSAGQRVSIDTDLLSINPAGTNSGDIFVQVQNGGSNTNITSARTTSGGIDILGTAGHLTTTGLVQADNGSTDHIVKLATTNGWNIFVNSSVKSQGSSGDVVIQSTDFISGTGSIEGQTVTLTAVNQIGTSVADQLDVDSAVLNATVTDSNKDIFVVDVGPVFSLGQASLSSNTNDFSASGTQIVLSGGATFSSNATGVLSGTLPATFSYTNTGGGFSIGALGGFTTATLTASTAINGTASTITGTDLFLNAATGVGTVGTPVKIGATNTTVSNTVSGEVNLSYAINGSFTVANAGGDVNVTSSAGATVLPSGVSSATGNVSLRNTSVGFGEVNLGGYTISAPAGSVTVDSDFRISGGGGNIVAGVKATLKDDDQGYSGMTISAPLVELQSGPTGGVSFTPASDMEIRTVGNHIGGQLNVNGSFLPYNITVGDITTGTFATINAGNGAILGSAGRLVTSSSVFLTAALGIGSSTTPVLTNTPTAGGMLANLNSSGGDVYVSELDAVYGVGGSAGLGKTFHYQAGGDLPTVNIAASGGTINLISGGQISRLSNALIANAVILSAANGIGVGGGMSTSATTLDAVSTTGNIQVADTASGLTVIRAQTGSNGVSADGNIFLSATGGNLVLGDGTNQMIRADGDSVTLQNVTTGQITDGNAATLNVKADSLAIIAISGIGIADQIDTDITSLDARTTTGNIAVSDTTGNLIVTRATTSVTGTITLTAAADLQLGDALNLGISTGTGAVNLTATGGAITDGNTGTNVTTSAVLTMNASTGIGASDAIELAVGTVNALSTTGDIEVVQAAGNLIVRQVATGTSGAGDGNISIEATAGGLTLSDNTNFSINASQDTVTLIAGAAITDGVGTASNVVANLFEAIAGTGIGSANAIEGDVSTIDAQSTTGTINVADGTGALVVRRAITGTASGGDGNVILQSPGDITLGDGAGFDIRALGDSVTLTSTAGSIVDNTTDSAVDVTGATVTLNADTGSVGITNGNIDVVATTLNGSAAAGNTFAVNVPGSGIQIDAIVAAGATVTINAAGDILDNASDTSVDITAATINLTAAGFNIGASGGNGSLDVSTSNFNATASNVTVASTATLGLGAITAAGGTVTLNAAAIVDDTSDAAVDITAATANLTATAGGVGVNANGSIDLAVSTVSASASTGNSISLESVGAVAINTISASNGTVQLVAGGAISDANGAALNITANLLGLVAISGGIGAGDAMETTVGTVNATVTGANNIEIFETDSLVLGNVSAGSGNVRLILGSGTLTQVSTLVAGGLLVQGFATSYMLPNPANAIGTLAANVTGTLNYRDSDGLTVGTVFGNSGITTNGDATLTVGGALIIDEDVNVGAANLTLNVAGTTTQSSGDTITATGLELLGAGSATLSEAGNAVTTIAINKGDAVNYRDTNALIVGTVNTVGITTSNDNVTLQTGGALTFNNAVDLATGAVSAGGNLLLNVTGDISQIASASIQGVGSSRVDLQACKLEYSIVSPK